MNWEAIGAIAEALGAIGVIASVLYLAVQIRTNTKSQESTVQHSLHEETVSRMMAFAQDTDLAEKLVKANQSWDELSVIEKAQVASFTRAVFKGFENIYLQHQRGFYSEEDFVGAIEAMRLNVRPSYFDRFWERDKITFRRSFQDFIDELRTDD
jgi:hypothetical protein